MALTITLTLTDDEAADVAATVAPATPQEWIASNLAALVKQCTSAQRARRMAAAAAMAGIASVDDLSEAEFDIAVMAIGADRASKATPIAPPEATPITMIP